MESIKKISEYVAQLRRVGKGHGMTESFLYQHHVIICLFFKNLEWNLSGVWHFDQMLLHEAAAA